MTITDASGRAALWQRIASIVARNARKAANDGLLQHAAELQVAATLAYDLARDFLDQHTRLMSANQQ